MLEKNENQLLDLTKTALEKRGKSLNNLIDINNQDLPEEVVKNRSTLLTDIIVQGSNKGKGENL